VKLKTALETTTGGGREKTLKKTGKELQEQPAKRGASDSYGSGRGIRVLRGG